MARYGGAAFLGVLFLVNVYRAITQSIVCDEAFSWQLFLSRPVSSVFQTWDANNHLLATLSFWASWHLLRQKEWVMRLPSLLGGAWYLVTMFRLYSRVLDRPLLFLLALGVSVLNPLVLDFMVAARGYGLAVAGLAYAILALVDHLEKRDRWSMGRAAFGICLSIGFNLTCLVPCTMLIVSFALIVAAARGVKRALMESSFLAGPAVAFCAAIYFIFPLHKAKRADFYVGLDTWMESFRNLLRVSFYHNGYIGDPNPLPRMVEIYLDVAAIVTGALLLWMAVRFVLGLAAIRRDGAGGEVAFLLSAGTLCGSMVALFVAHQVLGVRYPIDRTGLYFLALVPMAVATLGGKWIQVSALVSTAVLIAFMCQWNTRFFYVWRYDADTKGILRVLERRVRHPIEPRVQVRLGISWLLEPSINYYRIVRGSYWMAEVGLSGPNGVYDYYVITPAMKDLTDDRAVMKERSLVPIYQGPVSGTVLAIPPVK
ncbi:MAG TPA: hypothetical protein VEU96_32810 [Bryobacteraceae bacterium]|nr:hypothetical protein [Bryobacteraceae bacterium]